MIALKLLDESYARELARVLDLGLTAIQQALRSLERDGLVAGRLVGRSRVFRIDPRYFAYDDLTRYLARLAEPDHDLQVRAESLRRRQRRSGKSL